MKEKSKTNWGFNIFAFGLGFAANLLFPGLGIAVKSAFKESFAPAGEGGAFEYETDEDGLSWVHFQNDEEAEAFEQNGVEFEGFEELEDGSFYAAISEHDMDLAAEAASSYMDYADALGVFGVDGWI